MTTESLYHAWRSRRAAQKLRAAAQEVEQQFSRLPAFEVDLAQRFKNASTLTEQFAWVMLAIEHETGLRLHTEQISAGLALLQGSLIEMATGEGKTLSVVAPAAVLALRGEGVHVVSANAYLARRDAEALRPIFSAIGLTVGVIEQEQSLEDKRSAYRADITYGVHSEFGFDRMRDERALSADARVQRSLAHAIIDEADAVLLDDARTPLILSANAPEETSDLIRAADEFLRTLDLAGDLIVDPVRFTAVLTESGYAKLESWALARQLSPESQGALYAGANGALLQAVLAAVKAYALYRRNDHYLVADGEIVIIDAMTGRVSTGRRWGDGIHEALEAKEGLRIHPGTVTTNRITYQSFFRLYGHLCGLTGTAMADADEFADAYGLQVVAIPRHNGLLRTSQPDVIFASAAERWAAVIDVAGGAQNRGQPVLIGTRSVEDAELLSRLAADAGLRFQALTARDAAYEAQRIEQAGRPGMVTIATAVAGRGTDIVLGGPKPLEREKYERWALDRNQAISQGGLLVIGCDRSGSPRVDAQLEGRSGRQGDPGATVFLLSAEDELFKSRRRGLDAVFSKLQGLPIAGAHARRWVKQAQFSDQANSAQDRKNMGAFEAVERAQREAFLQFRAEVMDEQFDLSEALQPAIADWTLQFLTRFELGGEEEGQLKAALEELKARTLAHLPLVKWVLKGLDANEMEALARPLISATLGEKLQDADAARHSLLQLMDQAWSDHLEHLDVLKAGASRYAQVGVNPLFHFTKVASQAFEDLIRETLSRWVDLQVAPVPLAPPASPIGENWRAELAQRWVLRTEPCPCGSGQRFKACHGGPRLSLALAA